MGERVSMSQISLLQFRLTFAQVQDLLAVAVVFAKPRLTNFALSNRQPVYGLPDGANRGDMRTALKLVLHVQDVSCVGRLSHHKLRNSFGELNCY